jgi:DNA-binding transcriptional LysR family regulator
MISNVSDLDLRLIRTFLAVVDARGVTAAQVTLNVSQPAISSQLATLETRLGFRLCERGRSGFSLTGRGERFAESARKLLDAIDNFSTESRNLDKKLIGKLTICIIGHAELKQNARLSQAIQRFLGRDQAVHLSVIVRSPGEIEQEVFSGAWQSDTSGTEPRCWIMYRSSSRSRRHIVEPVIRCSDDVVRQNPSSPI